MAPINMSATFHLFPLLPPELRLKIWNLAIRDYSRKGVHFFGIDSRTGRRHGDLLALKPTECGKTCNDCADECDDDSYHPFSETLSHGNKSSHFIDSGLWDTCYESRQVMIQRFGRVTPRLHFGLVNETAYATYGYFDVNGETRHITFSPYQDLFVMTAHEFYYATERHYSLDLLFGPMRLTSESMHHFGLEMAPSWYSEGWSSLQCRQIRKWVMDAMMELPERVTIYFIDYRLRLEEASRTEQENEVFYANSGRFIEVQEADNWDYDDGMIWLKRRHCFYFIDKLKEEIAEKILQYYGRSWYTEFPKLAVLAWVPD